MRFPLPETNPNSKITKSIPSQIQVSKSHTHTHKLVLARISIFTLGSLRSSRSSLNDSPGARDGMIIDDRRRRRKKEEERERGGVESSSPLPRFRTKPRLTAADPRIWHFRSFPVSKGARPRESTSGIASPRLASPPPSPVSRNTWWTGPRGRECTVSSRCNRRKKKSRAVTKAGV